MGVDREHLRFKVGSEILANLGRDFVHIVYCSMPAARLSGRILSEQSEALVVAELGIERAMCSPVRVRPVFLPRLIERDFLHFH